MNKLKIGEVVVSLAGHDQGNLFIIKEIIDNENVLVVDGKNRPISKPKKKKCKHLTSIGVCEIEIARKLEGNAYILDAEIVSALKKYRNY